MLLDWDVTNLAVHQLQHQQWLQQDLCQRRPQYSISTSHTRHSMWVVQGSGHPQQLARLQESQLHRAKSRSSCGILAALGR